MADITWEDKYPTKISTCTLWNGLQDPKQFRTTVSPWFKPDTFVSSNNRMNPCPFATEHKLLPEKKMALIDSMGAWIRAICTFLNYSYWNRPTLSAHNSRRAKKNGSLLHYYRPTDWGYFPIIFSASLTLRFMCMVPFLCRNGTALRQSLRARKARKKSAWNQKWLLYRPALHRWYSVDESKLSIAVLEGEGKREREKITIYDFFSHFLISGNGCGHGMLHTVGTIFSPLFPRCMLGRYIEVALSV